MRARPSPHDWLGDYPQAGGGVGDHERQHRVLVSQGAGLIGHLSQGDDVGSANIGLSFRLIGYVKPEH